MGCHLIGARFWGGSTEVLSFNLVHEQWLPVLDRSGRPRLVGIREALLQAHTIERITPVSPLAEAALHRLLLAVLHRALGGPADLNDVIALYQAGRLPEEPLEAYFDRWSRRFDLFDTEAPFCQVPDLPDESPIPWTKLAAERASGNNPTLFDHSMDSEPQPITPAVTAAALVAHQSFTTGGLIKKLGVTSGKAGPLAGAAVFLPQGGTLFETLLLNLAPPYRPDDDLPIWEREPYRTPDIEGGRAKETLRGRTRVYTWMSRAVRLRPKADGMVRVMAYGPGVSPREGPELDPMCAYQRKAGTAVPYRLRKDRAFWRDFEAILPGDRGWIAPRTVDHARGLLREIGRLTLVFPLTVIGQDTAQDKVLDARRETYPLSARALDPTEAAAIRGAVGEANDAGGQLDRTARAVARVLLGLDNGRSAGKEVRRLAESFPLLRLYWSRLETAFPEFLEALASKGRDDASAAWSRAVRDAARTSWNATAAAIGSTARHLKAIAEGERIVSQLLRRPAT
jgi:CRISPR system Cascade subunit CasA